MAAPFLIVPKGDEAVDNGIVQMNVLLEPGKAEGFAVFVSTFPPLGGGPPSHHHDSYDEAFYVLSGEMEFRVDGETARVPAGSMAWVPRGATHGFRNPCAEPARMLVVTTPDAIDLIIRMPEGLRNPDAMRALFAEHDSQVDGPPLHATGDQVGREDFLGPAMLPMTAPGMVANGISQFRSSTPSAPSAATSSARRR